MSVFLDVLLWTMVVLLTIASVLPITKMPVGFIRSLDFPKEQFFAMSVGLAGLAYFARPDWLWGFGGLVFALLAGMQLIYIVKFTPVWPRQSTRASGALAEDSDKHVSMLAVNVKKSNRNYDALTQMVRRNGPDIVMAIEVDDDWIAALKADLGGMFDHWIDVPKDNGYGICVMSKLRLIGPEVRELIVQDVPSIRTEVRLRSGKAFRLYVVHPEPPTIHHDTKGRDSEIAIIGLEASKDPLPSIVTGDLNDVAWSTTTRRFQRLSGLLDPRVGRGFYNTFSATMPWMRWPLDHLFHDPAFRLIKMTRLGKVGSDHFPMWFVLALGGENDNAVDPGEADAEEKMETRRMIVEERKRDREPIGSDWEDE
ncbi:YD repeat domain protein [Sulfitobacter noctilucae]|uniref:endonuclease/exonuclease/phosphatase family protein n=1 Tax=Sulfitobacter noctilucae TaxID=1342302 RepID=UPI000468B492|nr:endonuclease/exonuclease/phosphatase family protein [Sulfitobacter noctilucae]KIN65374.1 YD repeat domain protein [Sulfitobacter noctilucae]